MYTIAIVDDDSYDLNRMTNFVTQNKEFDNSMDIISFHSGIDFLSENKVPVDILIIDMQMNLMGGFETARELRKVNINAVLCFCSAVVRPQVEHFEVQPYRYILKTDSKERIEQTVTDILAEMKRRKEDKTAELVIDTKPALVSIRDILYLEKQKHGTLAVISRKCPLYKEDAKIFSRKKLTDLAPVFEPEGFAIPHLSYMVNIKKIISISGTSISMENGDIIPISRSCRENFRAESAKFFNKKYQE